jgi:hypothetical protein
MVGMRLSFAVLLVSAMLPVTAQAQCCGKGLFRRHHRLFDPCGPGCAAPMFDPCCGPPMGDACCPMPPQAVFAPPAECCMQLQPVVETCMVPQQYTTFKDVPQTCYRQEAFCQNVPVTTCRQITVDEGGFQQIWVPKLVNKTISQTTMTQQVALRTVPVQTMTRVPVTQTIMVPQQRVTYVPQPVMAAPSCCGPGIMPGGVPTLGPAIVPEGSSVPPLPGGPLVPPSSLTPHAYNPPTGTAATKLVPTPTDAVATPQTAEKEEDWQKVERRAAFFEKEFGYKPFGSPIQQAGFSRPLAK